MTTPCMPATTGTVNCSSCLNRSRNSASLGGPENSLMSAPEMKVLPLHTSTTAAAAGRERMSSIAANNPWRTAALRVLTGGLSTEMTATSPSMLRVTGPTLILNSRFFVIHTVWKVA